MKQELANFATIGIRSTGSHDLVEQVAGHTPACRPARPARRLLGGDRIVGVGWSTDSVPSGPTQLGELPADELEAALAANLDRADDVPGANARKSRLPANRPCKPSTSPCRPIRLKRVGIEMQIGPIVAVREESPAAAAGFQVGDRDHASARGRRLEIHCSCPNACASGLGRDVPIVVDRVVGRRATTASN